VTALTTGAQAWVEGHDIPDVESLNLPDSEVGKLAAAAYNDQTILGWHALFRGFRASSWRTAQEEVFRNYPRYKLDKQDTGEAWSGRTITWFFDLFETLWKQRCDIQHGTTPEEQEQVRSVLADRAIQ